MKFVLKYGNDVEKMKRVEVETREQAERMYDKVVSFAEKHNLSWMVALFTQEKWGLWLDKTTTVNPERVIILN